jgi:hypothetical protein
MSKINVGRVVLGGVVAGIIIDVFESVLNGGFLAPQWTEIMHSINRPELGTNGIIMYDVMGFVLGFAAVWIYAAIRPRFGAGVKTAIYAALVVWFAGYLYADVDHMIIGVYPANLTLILIGVGLIEIIVATIAGAWLYKEA